jgi:hypothetical protein
MVMQPGPVYQQPPTMICNAPMVFGEL